jgi:hypothetical protein
MNNTTVLDKKIDFELLTKSTELLDDDPEEPKTLDEIAKEVGIPFKARAVLYLQPSVTSEKMIPVGEVRTFIGRISKAGEHHPMLNSSWPSNIDNIDIGKYWCHENKDKVNNKLKRWVLVNE